MILRDNPERQWRDEVITKLSNIYSFIWGGSSEAHRMQNMRWDAGSFPGGAGAKKYWHTVMESEPEPKTLNCCRLNKVELELF